MWESTPGYGDAKLLDTLWAAIDEAIELKGCDVYSYQSDGETDPFGAQCRILSCGCACVVAVCSDNTHYGWEGGSMGSVGRS